MTSCKAKSNFLVFEVCENVCATNSVIRLRHRLVLTVVRPVGGLLLPLLVVVGVSGKRAVHVFPALVNDFSNTL